MLNGGLWKSEKSVITYLTLQMMCTESKTAGNGKMSLYFNANPNVKYLHLNLIHQDRHFKRNSNSYFTNIIHYAGILWQCSCCSFPSEMYVYFDIFTVYSYNNKIIWLTLVSLSVYPFVLAAVGALIDYCQHTAASQSELQLMLYGLDFI